MLGKLILNTRIQIALILASVWIFFLIYNWSLAAFFMPLFSVLLVSILDVLNAYIRKKIVYLPGPSIVTGFLIGLILPFSAEWYVFVLACGIASLSKQFIGEGLHRHVFNPAALGILTTSILLDVPIAWWAASWSQWVIIIILAASYVLYRLNRLWLPGTFLLTYGVYFFVATGTFPQHILLDGTVIFFAFIMLPEPITSIIQGKWKYSFGVLVAILSIVIGRVGIFLPDVFLPSLLLANLIGFFAKKA